MPGLCYNSDGRARRQPVLSRPSGCLCIRWLSTVSQNSRVGEKHRSLEIALETAILWPLLIYAVLVLVVAGGMLTISHLLGERRERGETAQPYESGILPTTPARLRFGVKFYMVSLFFVIFDLEAVFLLTWAIAFRDVGWAGYVEAVVFVAILVAALIYLWRVGALDWGPRILEAGPESRRRERER
jgi:NADH-quinone oxidoreductase subunit A